MVRKSEIGWSVEARLLHEIDKKLDKLIKLFHLTTTITTTFNPL